MARLEQDAVLAPLSHCAACSQSESVIGKYERPPHVSHRRAVETQAFLWLVEVHDRLPQIVQEAGEDCSSEAPVFWAETALCSRCLTVGRLVRSRKKSTSV